MPRNGDPTRRSCRRDSRGSASPDSPNDSATDGRARRRRDGDYPRRSARRRLKGGPHRYSRAPITTMGSRITPGASSRRPGGPESATDDDDARRDAGGPERRGQAKNVRGRTPFAVAESSRVCDRRRFRRGRPQPSRRQIPERPNTFAAWDFCFRGGGFQAQARADEDHGSVNFQMLRMKRDFNSSGCKSSAAWPR